MRAKASILTALIGAVVALPAQALELSSSDIEEGHPMARTFEYSGWGCDGDNVSPQLAWQGAPQGTKSFAVTAFDPDAPTGSGFWHWMVFDLPADVNALPRGADIQRLGGIESRIDYGTAGFGGACPPNGDGMHRYQFTVWALPTESLALDDNTPAAVVGFTLRNRAIAHTTLTATYTR